MQKTYLYIEIASGLKKLIDQGILQDGDKLPSVRVLSKEYNISVNTAKRVYWELESQNLIYAKAQSGFFVSRMDEVDLPLVQETSPRLSPSKSAPSEIIQAVYSDMGNKDMTLFSFSAPYGELLPIAKIKKQIIQAAKILPSAGIDYEPVQGNLNLRKMVAMRSLLWGGNLSEADIITTNGAMNALALCLMAIGKAGDTIAIESPCYPGILQLASSFGLKVLELPTNPTTGIKIQALKDVIDKIDICLLISNYNTPFGSCMPIENKQEVVKLLHQYNIPLIEDDVYGDLSFSQKRPLCCKSFDKYDNVIYCSSASKTLVPGYRVGWIAPGRYKEQILQKKLFHSITSASIVQEALANFFKLGLYDKHLVKLRKDLYSNYLRFVQVIQKHYPLGTKTSRPQGGMALWVEFDPRLDTTILYNLAIDKKISIAPGRMFTLQDQYMNCMRLCFGLPWNDKVKKDLITLGNLAHDLLGKSS
ncbi:aminotransferase-like domain-containing protein [Myroides sp. LJL116]